MTRAFIALTLCLLLAACGSGEDTDPDTPPTATPIPSPTPPLPVDERVTFSPGTLENPYRMMMVPSSLVAEQVVTLLEAFDDEISPVTTLRDDLGIEDYEAQLDPLLLATFGIDIRPFEIDAIETVADLTDFVQRRVAAEAVRGLQAASAIYFEIVFVETHGEALTALCNSDQGIVSVAWLNGPTYVAAEALNCGQAALQLLVSEEPFAIAPFEVLEPVVSAESTAEATAEAQPTSPPPTATPEPIDPDDLDALRAGNPAQIVVTAELGSTSLALFDTRPICRLGLQDFYSWFVPALLLESANIEPDSIIEYDDPSAMFAAVADGTCAGAGFSRDQLAAFEDRADFDNVTIAQTTPPFPYGVLFYPLEVELGVRLNLNESIPAYALNPTDGRYLRFLLGYDAIVPLDEDTITAMEDFLTETGYDFAELGT
jgi:hypothetical protein